MSGPKRQRSATDYNYYYFNIVSASSRLHSLTAHKLKWNETIKNEKCYLVVGGAATPYDRKRRDREKNEKIGHCTIGKMQKKNLPAFMWPPLIACNTCLDERCTNLKCPHVRWAGDWHTHIHTHTFSSTIIWTFAHAIYNVNMPRMLL